MVAMGTLLNELAGRWLPWMLDASIKGLAVLIAAGGAMLLMRRSSAAARQLVWMLALAALLVLPVLSLALPGWRVLPSWTSVEVPTPPAANPVADTVAMPAPSEAVSADADANVDLPPDEPMTASPIAAEPVELPAPVAEEPTLDAPATPPAAVVAKLTAPRAPDAAPAKPSPAVNIQSWAMLAWLAGMLACLTPLVLARLSLWRLGRAASPVVGGSWHALLKQAAEQLGLGRSVSLVESDRRAMPMVWGVFRPRLLLPAEAKDWAADRCWVVVLHELAHVKRWDCLAKLIGRLACAAYWFNPLAWLAFKRLQAEAEGACDDLVLASGHRPSNYAEHLLQIASGLETGMLASHSSIAFARPSKLEGRLLAILDAGRNRTRLTRWGALATVILAVVVAVPLALLRAADPQSAALSAVSAWAKHRGWNAKEVEKTTLESRWGGWQNLPFEVDSAEEADAKACGELVKKIHFLHNGKSEFNDEATRVALEKILQGRAEYFYAEFLLGIWHRNNGNAAESDKYLEAAYKHAPIVIVQRYEMSDGAPLRNASVQRFALECNRVKRGSLDPSLVLDYCDLRTDQEGCIYLPAYDTVFRWTNASTPEGYRADYPRLGWFQATRKVGLLPTCLVEPSAATQSSRKSSDEAAIREVALKFLAAMRDNDLEAMKALSAGSVEGWVGKEAPAPSFTGEPPVGWSAQSLNRAAGEVRREVFAKHPDAATTVVESAIDGEFSATRSPYLDAGNSSKYLVLIFVRTAGGWRFATLDDARAPLKDELAEHAAHMGRLDLSAAIAPGTATAATLRDLLSQKVGTDMELVAARRVMGPQHRVSMRLAERAEALAAKVVQIESALSPSATSQAYGQQLESLAQQQRQLEMTLGGLRKNLGPDHRTVKNFEMQLADLQAESTAMVKQASAASQPAPTTQPASAKAPAGAAQFGGQVADRYVAALARQKLPFLSAAELEQIRSALTAFVASRRPATLSAQDEAAILEAVDNYVDAHFSGPDIARDALLRDLRYLAFPNDFKTFLWALDLAMRRQPLSPTDLERLAAQREWMRTFINGLPENQEINPPLTRAVAIQRLEKRFADPLCPVFHEPMTDEQFKQFQSDVASIPMNATVLGQAVWAMVNAVPMPSGKAAAAMLPFPDELVPWSQHNGLVELGFRSNAPFVGTANVLGDIEARQKVLDLGSGEIVSPDEATRGNAEAFQQWLRQPGHGDVGYDDAKGGALFTLRGGKLALLSAPDWMTADQMSDQDLRTLLTQHGVETVSVEALRGARDKPEVPAYRFLAVLGAEGQLAVWDNDVTIVCRHRPLPGTPVAMALRGLTSASSQTAAASQPASTPATQPTRTSAPAEGAVCPLAATVYELHLPADQVGKLDVAALSAAATPEAFTNALADLGQAKLLYNMDQPVRLSGDQIAINSDVPMAMVSTTTGSTVRYQSVGATLKIVGQPQSAGGINADLSLNVTANTDTDVLMTADRPAMAIRRITMGYKGMAQPRKPMVILGGDTVQADPDGKAVVYLARIVLGDVQPAGRTATNPATSQATSTRPAVAALAEGPACPLAATVYELRLPPDQISRLDAAALAAPSAPAAFEKALANLGQAKLLYRMDQPVRLAGDQIAIGIRAPRVMTSQVTNTGPVNVVAYQQVGVTLKIAGQPQADGGINTDLALSGSAMIDTGVSVPGDVSRASFRMITMGYKGLAQPGKPVVVLSVDANQLDASGKAVVYLARIVLGNVSPAGQGGANQTLQATIARSVPAAPAEAPVAPLAATIFELRLPAGKVGRIDAAALAAAANPAAFEKALANLGQAKLLYLMDQPVRLSGDQIATGSRVPIVVNSTATDKGRTTRVSYENVGATLKIAGRPQSGGGINTDLSVDVTAVTDTQVNLAASQPASAIRTVALGYKGLTQPGKPLVILGADASLPDASGNAVVYLARIVLGAPAGQTGVNPTSQPTNARAAPAAPAEGPVAPLAATVCELRLPADQVGRLDVAALAAAADPAAFEKALANLGQAKPLYLMDQSVRLSGDQIAISSRVPIVADLAVTDGRRVSRVSYQSVGATLKIVGQLQSGGLINTDISLNVTAVVDTEVSLAASQPAPAIRTIAMGYKGLAQPGKSLVILSADASQLDASGKAVIYLARIVLGAPAGQSGANQISQPTSARSVPAAPAEGPVCPLMATVYELRLPADQVGRIDVTTLTAAANPAAFEKSLADLGQARLLYRMDQPVRLSGDQIAIGSKMPRMTASQVTDAGPINEVKYEALGMTLKIVGQPQSGGAISADLALNVTAMADTGARPASPVRTITMGYKGSAPPGQPLVILNADASQPDVSDNAVVYVARIVLGDVHPATHSANGQTSRPEVAASPSGASSAATPLAR